MADRTMGSRIVVPTIIATIGAWVMAAFGYAQFVGDTNKVTQPGVVSVLFIIAALLLAAFLIHPTLLLYTYGGVVSAVALSGRAFLIIWSALTDPDRPNQLGILAIYTGLTGLFVWFFWLFWQGSVRRWLQSKQKV